MIDVREVKRYVEQEYEKHPWLRPAKHVLVVLDEIVYQDLDRRLRFSGLQPSWRRDTIIISWPLLRPDTIVHETLHTYGCGEDCAWTLAPRIVEFREKFPPLLRRKVEYEVCPGDASCPYYELHRMLGSKLIHLILK